MSVTVVSIGPEASAGSTFIFLRKSGKVPPIDTATTVLIANAPPTTNPRYALLCHSQATTPYEGAQHQPVDESYRNLLHPHPPNLKRLDHPQRQLTQTNCHCLIPRASAHIRNHRQKDGQGDYGAQSFLIKSDNAGGNYIEQNVNTEPRQAPF